MQMGSYGQQLRRRQRKRGIDKCHDVGNLHVAAVSSPLMKAVAQRQALSFSFFQFFVKPSTPKTNKIMAIGGCMKKSERRKFAAARRKLTATKQQLAAAEQNSSIRTNSQPIPNASTGAQQKKGKTKMITLVCSVFVAIVTFGIWRATVRSADYTERSANATDRSANASQEQAAAQQEANARTAGLRGTASR
jgi:hypothetical protein